MKVVLISKDDEFKQSFKAFLDSEGFNVESYSKITSFAPNLKNQFIIFDHSEISDEEVTDIRNRFSNQLMKGYFVFMTNDMESLASSHLEALCANEIIAKPVSNEYLFSRVRSFFEKANSSNDNSKSFEANIEDAGFFSLLSEMAFLRHDLEKHDRFELPEFLRISNQLFMYLNLNTSRICGDKLTEESFMDAIRKIWNIRTQLSTLRVRYKLDAKYFIFAFNDLLKNILNAGFLKERISIAASLESALYTMRISIDAISMFEVTRVNDIIRNESWRNIMHLNNIDYSVSSQNENYLIELTIPYETY